MGTESYDLSPEKEIFRSWSGDLSVIEAIQELVDNAIDNWTRRNDRQTDITVEIQVSERTTTVIDDTGGITEAEIDALFTTGGTIDQSDSMSIGAYAMGAKKAIPRLGRLHQGVFDQAIIKSRDRSAPQGYGFTINSDWFKTNDWTISQEEFRHLEPGKTEITVQSTEQVWDEKTIESLHRELSKTYDQFLRGTATGQEGDFILSVNEASVEAEREIDWSYIPIDGLYPRTYRGIRLGTEYLSEPIDATITVGLMCQKDSKLAGTDIYCQDRLVVANNTEAIGGFAQGDDKIGNFTTHNERLKVIVELRTDGDPKNLPWGIQKRTIDTSNRITRDLHVNLKEFVTPYFDADADTVPAAVATQYGDDIEAPALEREIEQVTVRSGDGSSHYVSQEDRPKEGLPRLQELKKFAKLHGLTGIIIDTDTYELGTQTSLTEEEVPAYERLVSWYAEGKELQPRSPDEAQQVVDEAMDLQEYVGQIDLVGEAKAEKLIQAGYYSVSTLEEAAVDEITRIDGIGRPTAKRLLQEGDTNREDEKPDHVKQTRGNVEKGAMQRAMKYEREAGREPIDVSGDLERGGGYDIISKHPETEETCRYIEVKGRSRVGDVTLTEAQWQTAETHGEKFWLYVVPYAKRVLEDRKDPSIFTIQDPAAKLEPTEERIDEPKYQYRIKPEEYQRYPTHE